MFTRAILFLLAFAGASVAAPPVHWTTVEAKVPASDTVIVYKEAGTPQLEWSPAVKGAVLLLMVVKANGPVQDGKIQIDARTNMLGVAGDEPVTIEYLKPKLKLTPGYYAVRVTGGSHTSDFIVIAIK